MKEAAEMTHLMETVETQRQAFHQFPQALGNPAHTARFPHSPQLRRLRLQVETHNSYDRCFPDLRVTSLSDPTDTGLGYLIK